LLAWFWLRSWRPGRGRKATAPAGGSRHVAEQ